jgi:hypothetical protein
MVGTYNFTILQGSTFNRVFTWAIDGSAVDLTGYTAKAQLRPSKNSSTVVLELSTENGRITLGGEDGTISIDISAEDTTELDFNSCFWDLELYQGITTRRLLEGKVSLNKEVTR